MEEEINVVKSITDKIHIFTGEKIYDNEVIIEYEHFKRRLQVCRNKLPLIKCLEPSVSNGLPSNAFMIEK